MSQASIHVSVDCIAEILQLPDYLAVTQVAIDVETRELIVDVESEIIPDGVTELVPLYTLDEIPVPGENAAIGRRLVGIDLLPTPAEA